MKLTSLTLGNPKSFWAVLAIFLVLSGIAYFNTPMRMMPALESPMLAIITQGNGEVATIESQITIPVEAHVRDLASLRLVRSSSSNSTSTVLLQYAWGTDMIQAKMNLLAKVSEINNVLSVPHSIPTVITVDPLNLPVVIYGISAPEKELEKAQKEAAKLADTIRIGTGLSSNENKGIRAVLVSGGTTGTGSTVTTTSPPPSPTPQVVTPSAKAPVISSIRVSPAQKSTPESKEAPAPNMEGISAPTVQKSVEPEVMADTKTPGVFVAMKSWSDYTFDGQKGVELAVYGDANADSRSIVQEVAEKTKAWQMEHPEYTMTKVYDNSHFITLLGENMVEELLFSVILAALMLLIFLQDIRAMLIVLVTIPISLAGAFLILPLLGMSLNSSTLVGLLLAIGRLVDDSIIVIHAVHRHMKAGLSKKKAALAGVKEVYLAILSSTIIMMIAVLPLAFAPGLTGIMFKGIVVPILMALSVSFFISVTLTPLLATALFKEGSGEQKRPWWNPLRWIYTASELVLSALEWLYQKLLGTCLRHRIVTVVIAILIASAGINLFQKIGNEMMPLADTAQISLMYDLKSDLTATEKVQQSLAIEKIFLAQPEVDHISSELGMTDASYINFTGFNPMSESSVSSLITLKDKGERQASIWNVIDRIASELQNNPAITKLSMKEMGADVMATAGAPAEIVISADNRSLLQFFAQEVFTKVKEISVLKLPNTTGLDQDRLLWRENFKPSVVLGGFYRSGDLPSMQLVGRMWGVAEREKQAVLDQTASKDYSKISIAGRGDMVEMMDATNVLLSNLLIAAGLIFLFLIIFFRSFSLPLIIFLAIPLELSGVLGGLYFMGQTFSTVSILGIIILNGIDVATAILLIDFLQHNEAKTKAERNAHVVKAATIRLRPVLMTVLITLIVLIPLAFHPKAGIDAFSPLATVILGGLTMSSLLVLMVVPTLFTLMDDIRFLRRK